MKLFIYLLSSCARQKHWEENTTENTETFWGPSTKKMFFSSVHSITEETRRSNSFSRNRRQNRTKSRERLGMMNLHQLNCDFDDMIIEYRKSEPKTVRAVINMLTIARRITFQIETMIILWICWRRVSTARDRDSKCVFLSDRSLIADSSSHTTQTLCSRRSPNNERSWIALRISRELKRQI
jgi:hypothetical protein